MKISSFQGWFAARLPKGRVARSILALAGGTAAAQAITICTMPVVTRLYTPAEIGVISLFLSFFTFWSPTLSLRYEYALLIAKDDCESHVVSRLAVYCVIGVSSLALPFLWGLKHFNVLGFGLLPTWAGIPAVPIMVGYGLFMVYRSWALRAGLVQFITKASVARSAANSITRVGSGVVGAGIVGLFAAEFAGAWGAGLSLYRAVRCHFLPSRPVLISIAMLRATARRYIKFLAFETPSTLANQLALTLPLPMIASLHGAEAAGWFGLARAMVGIPNAQIGSAVADVFQMELAKAVLENNLAAARLLFYQLLRKLALYGLLPLIGMILFAPTLMSVVFGHAWVQAGWAAAIIAPWLYASLVVSSLSRALSVLQAQEYKLFYDAIAVLLLGGVYIVSQSMELAFLPMVIALSAAGVLGYAVYLILIVAIVESRLRKSDL